MSESTLIKTQSSKSEARYKSVAPGEFAPEKHFYPRVLNAQIHALVRFFLNLSSARIVERFAHLNPRTDKAELTNLLEYQPRYFRWAGTDLMHVTTAAGVRKMVVVETNSCPSGQKSMPLYEEHDEQGGYRALIEETFKPLLKSRRLPPGGLAVLFDKNEIESSGYAAAMADVCGEPVHLVPFFDGDHANVRFDDGVLMVRVGDGWHPIRAAFRYVTQRPWNRLPIGTKTAILNPIVTCLAGGRNKMVAAKAYDLFNGELRGTGLSIHTPETFWDVALAEIPLWVQRLDGHAVVKVPYSNAGQGVYTITSPAELDAFMEVEHPYDRFIVQSLMGNYRWSSGPADRRLFQVGTVPDKKNHSFVNDLRFMVIGTPAGFKPAAIYARRARKPLSDTLVDAGSSWDMLGTNLSVKQDDGAWASEADRLLLMDRKDFNRLGVGVDDLIEAYVQSVLATVAIDRMCINLISSKGKLRMKLFRSLNDDESLLKEVLG